MVPMPSSSSGKIVLSDHQIQGSGNMQPHFDHAAVAGHDDFFDQMLSTLPSAWSDLGNPKSPWDLGNSTGSGPAETSDGIDYAPYDESSLLASRLRQHQISGGTSPAGKGMVLQLNHHHSGLLPLPLSLGSESLVDQSRDEGGDGLYNGFAGSMQRGANPTASQQHFHNPPGAAMLAQNYGGSPATGPAGGVAAPPRQRVRARRGQATDPHSIAERLRRERIAERMKALQELVPNANKTDKASMLDEIIDYVKFLQLQVKVLSMSRLGGAAAVAPLVADISSEGGRGGNTAAGNDSLAVTEHQVAKLMEEDMGSAMQYLQGKGLCLMPISLASAISTASCHPRGSGAAAALTSLLGAGNAGLMLAPPPAANNNGGGGGDAPPSPSMSALTAQSAVANGGAAKEAASVSKP